jgi:hypothetical protein
MAFNLGAFASGLAKGGIGTYVTLQELEEKKKEREMREAADRRQAIEFEDRMREKESVRSAAAESYGRIGKAALSGDLQADTGIGPQQAAGLTNNSGDAFDAYDRAQIAETLRQNAQRQGEVAATPEAKAVAAQYNPARPTMTKEMAADEYSKRLYAAGLTEKAQAAEAGALNISSGKRAERYAQRQETALGFQQNVLDSLKQANGDIAKVLEEHFVPIYNEGKLPGLDDGKTATIAKNAMGGNSIVLTDKKGKQEVLPADINTLQSLTSKVQDLMMASSSPENYWRGKEDFRKNQELKLSERRVGIEAEKLGVDKDTLKLNRDKFAEEQKLTPGKIAESEAKVKNYNADANYRNSLAKSLGEKTGNWAVLGADTDGEPISYDKNTGNFARKDGKPIQDVTFFKKITGERDAKPVPDKANEQLQKNYADEVSGAKTPEEIKAIQKKYSTLGVSTGYVDPVAAAMKDAKPGSDPFAGGGKGGTVAAPKAAIPMPTPAPVPRYGNISQEVTGPITDRIGNLDIEIERAMQTLRQQPTPQNAQVLQTLRAQRDQLAANPLIR